MSPSQIALAVCVALFAVYFIAAKSGQISQEEAHKLVKDGALLMDVRTEQEFSSGHIQGAVNHPVSALEKSAQKLKKEQTVVVYRRSGARSSRAKRILEKMGFKRVENLGAMSNW